MALKGENKKPETTMGEPIIIAETIIKTKRMIKNCLKLREQNGLKKSSARVTRGGVYYINYTWMCRFYTFHNICDEILFVSFFLYVTLLHIFQSKYW